MKEVVDCETTKASARNTRDRENSGLNSAVQSRAKRTKKHRLEAEKVWGAAVAELQVRFACIDSSLSHREDVAPCLAPCCPRPDALSSFGIALINCA